MSWSDRFLLAEAFFWLAVSSFSIAFLPFKLVAGMASRPVRERAWNDEAARQAVRKIRWAVLAWSWRVPWKAVCFQRGLAAQIMLRRRGWAADLYYGARKDPQKGLAAHVWVRLADIDVVGCEDLSGYGLLTTFPLKIHT